MKNNIIENIRLEMKNHKSSVRIAARKGDTKTRTVHITLADSGRLLSLANALFVEIIIDKPDGNQCYNNCVISGDEIQYTLTSQTINVEGTCICHLEITFDDGAVVYSPEFALVVYEPKRNASVVKSQNEYKSLTEQVVMAKGYADAAANSAKSIARAENNALMYAERAEVAETTAGNHADRAEAAKENVAMNATNAAQAATDANIAVEVTQGYAQTAETALSGAQVAENNANIHAGNAEHSATNAKTYEENARGYADAAANSANFAGTSEVNAANSEANAKTYKEGAEEIYNNFRAEGNLTLGTTHDKAFYGDYGQRAYEHSTMTGNPHGTTAAQVGADAIGSAQASYENSVAYTDQAIAGLINGAPATLDTLKEIADAMKENATVVEALDAAIGTKANAVEVDTLIRVLTERVTVLEDMVGYPYLP